MDISLSSRPLKAKEKKSYTVATLYALTPFLLVTKATASNPAPNLSTAELVKVFSGEAVQWQGGVPIRIILRRKQDTSTKILISHFNGMAEVLVQARAIPGIPVALSEQDNMDLAETMTGSLTTGSLSAILAEKRALTPIAIDAVAPTVENLAPGAYKISKYFYLVTGSQTSELAQQFIRFIRSPDGTRILKRAGNLAVSTEGQPM